VWVIDVNWYTIIENLGVFGLLAGGVAWLIRELFKGMLNRDLEKFKSALEKDAISHKIRYERLQSERVEVTKEVYKRLVRLHASIRSITNQVQWGPQPSDEEKYRIAAEASKDLISYFDENRIFFEERLAKDIDSFLIALSKTGMNYQFHLQAANQDNPELAREQWDKTREQIGVEVPRILKQLEDSFRGILGIDNRAK